MARVRAAALGLAVCLGICQTAHSEPSYPRLLETRKIWDAAPHNAFTDLIRHRGRWYCAFREGAGHISPDGKVRILSSENGRDWSSLAIIPCPANRQDLRDPKLSVTPDDRLLLTAAAYKPTTQSYVWFSANGTDWGKENAIGPEDQWLWRTTWHGGVAYNFGRHMKSDDEFIQLYTSRDGKIFAPLGPRYFENGHANEHSLVFRDDGTCFCLLRRDHSGGDNSAQLGIATPPYEKWRWLDLGKQIGGPEMIELPDGRLLAALRLYDHVTRTSLCWVDPEAGTLTEFFRLPSWGWDTGYAGMVWHEDELWITYQSHEKIGEDKFRGKSSIYLARVEIRLRKAVPKER